VGACRGYLILLRGTPLSFFTYNATNNAYFTVRDLRPAENLTFSSLFVLCRINFTSSQSGIVF
jgi:hypothetical protein